MPCVSQCVSMTLKFTASYFLDNKIRMSTVTCTNRDRVKT